MKDGFLRGDKKELARKSSVRQLRSRIRASLFFNESEDGRTRGTPASDEQLARGFQGDEGGYHDLPQNDENDSGRARSRSFSDTLGDFFKPKRKRRKDEPGTDLEQGDDPDDRAGPSN